MATSAENPLGEFLKARRAKLDPSAFGLDTARRRTPGLRREEVAQRAAISAKWYTFLEQGRGGAPSTDVIDRLCRALGLSGTEREHLLRLAHPRRPKDEDAAGSGVSPALSRLLDAMEFIPAFVKSPSWDIVAWNRAASAALTDYAALPPDRRNLLRLLFSEPGTRSKTVDWEVHARFAVAAFRLETARVGWSRTALALVDELNRSSPAFAAIWRDNEVGTHGEGTKNIEHPAAGTLKFEYSTLAVEGRPELGLVVFTPATPSDAKRVRMLVTRRRTGGDVPRRSCQSS